MSQLLPKADTDVVLVGAGIMSATLGTLLRKLEPDWTVEVFERLDVAAAERAAARLQNGGELRVLVIV